jgi:mono/diheme cytochrome c family protein
MNKEVNYVLQGFLLTLVVIGAFKVSDLLLSIPPPPEEPKESYMQWCGNASPNYLNAYVYNKGNGPDGKAIFQSNCASCHSLFKDLTGPALAGVTERIPDRKLVYKWVRNPGAILKSGNVYFNTLKKRFGGVQMTSFEDLSDAEIDAIISYIENTYKHRRF